jgi:hypothetical protein
MKTKDYIAKKYNLRLSRDYFVDIPEMTKSIDLVNLFAELGFVRGVEIGTDEGEFAEMLLKTIPNLKLACVDPWKTEAYTKGEQPESGENQEFFDKRYKETVDKLKPWKPTIYRLTSMEALKECDDNVLDFAYIDGNHDFLNVTQDIHYWLKKIRSGGIIAGHDYCKFPFRKYNHVKAVVQAYAKSYALFPVFATMDNHKGLKRDKFRSWFIIKP